MAELETPAKATAPGSPADVNTCSTRPQLGKQKQYTFSNYWCDTMEDIVRPWQVSVWSPQKAPSTSSGCEPARGPKFQNKVAAARQHHGGFGSMLLTHDHHCT
jgi:hypothetical protein